MGWVLLSRLSGFLAGFNTVGFTPSSNLLLLQLLAWFSAFGNGGVPVSSTGGIVNTLTSVVCNDIAVATPGRRWPSLRGTQIGERR